MERKQLPRCKLNYSLKKELDLLDLLRAVMALVIFEIHVSNYSIAREMVLNNYTFWLSTPWWLGNWVFFIISGYVIGKGFYSGKYLTNKKGILQFYLKRFFRVCIPAWIILLFLFTLGFTKEMVLNNKTLFQLLTFCYYGGLSEAGVGAFWYLSVLLKYYLMAPFIYIFFRKLFLNDEKAGFMLFNIVAVLGFVYRFVIYGRNLDYYTNVSISLAGNLDFFLCGMLLNSITDGKKIYFLNKTSKKSALVYLSILVVVGCFINYKYFELEFLRKYICPTISIYAICAYIYIDGQKNISEPSFFGFLVNEFAKIGFPFFLLHSVVLVNISSVLNSRGYFFHVQFFIITFILTTIISFCFENCFEKFEYQE